nr:pentatricopeptide repeat protein AaPPR902 [Agave angustifolia]
MESEGFRPDLATFTTILNICSNLQSLEFGNQIHGLPKTGFKDSTAVNNAIISMFSGCGSIQEALNTFSWMPNHDRISWNAIISGLSYHGKGTEALNLFEKMGETNVKPDEIIFMGVLSACSHWGLVQEG